MLREDDVCCWMHEALALSGEVEPGAENVANTEGQEIRLSFVSHPTCGAALKRL